MTDTKPQTTPQCRKMPFDSQEEYEVACKAQEGKPMTPYQPQTMPENLHVMTKAVPIEPTEAQIDAGYEAANRKDHEGDYYYMDFDEIRKVYKAMVGAA